ncbi:MAG: class I SAM-dependent methyltransferase [Puia sp.]|nr:class I SAM-dependent methyltransferase [Puia sp.]
MTPAQAISLIDNNYIRSLSHPTRWADLGCGSGLFTRALADLLQPKSTIYAIDRERSLKKQTTRNEIEIRPLELDFVKDELDLQGLDGFLMANSLHYVKDQPGLLRKLKAALLPAHAFLIVEYDMDQPIPVWVPYPVSFTALESLFHAAGYQTIEKLAETPSRFGRANLYSALILM